MTAIASYDLKSEIVQSLSQPDNQAAKTVQLGAVKVLFTTNRRLKSTNASDVEPKPYPKTECVVPDDYDSWLS